MNFHIYFKYKRLIGIITLMLISNLSISQITIKGRIIDSSTKSGINYACVQKPETNIGCISDFNGYFILDSISHIPETLVFSCIGYESKRINTNDIPLQDSLIIYLDSKVFDIDEVVIANVDGKKRKAILGEKSRDLFRSSPLYFASQKVRYFNFDNSPAYIGKFSFFVSRIKETKRARIRIYDTYSNDTIPRNDILLENIIVDVKSGWNTVDLSDYKIQIPIHGFFIGLESVVIDRDCFKQNIDGRWVSYYDDFAIGCTKEETISTSKTMRIGDYTRNGERVIRENDWYVISKHGFNFLYRVKIFYYE